ncbi:MAG TPA: GapA-binding peptide SR1P [Candidatus Bathyarchaeia archaeon]|nr:GapA-binding peptide SR1P [Candidatus Bathyarchaeia archaeon]
MGTIVCQECGIIIDHFESNQVKTLYGVCDCECGKYTEETE